MTSISPDPPTYKKWMNRIRSQGNHPTIEILLWKQMFANRFGLGDDLGNLLFIPFLFLTIFPVCRMAFKWRLKILVINLNFLCSLFYRERGFISNGCLTGYRTFPDAPLSLDSILASNREFPPMRIFIVHTFSPQDLQTSEASPYSDRRLFTGLVFAVFIEMIFLICSKNTEFSVKHRKHQALIIMATIPHVFFAILT
jgi:hypothetical protein